MNQYEQDRPYQFSLLQLADARAERWFRIAMVGWAVAICATGLLGWLLAIWP
mgnify:CR=1 FL=1